MIKRLISLLLCLLVLPCQGARWVVWSNASTIASPVLWYKFNDASGTSAADASGNGNTGTLNGSPTSTWTTGPNTNGAINFITTQGQFVSAGNPAVVQITGALSLTCWVRMTTLVDSSIIAKDASGQRAYTLDYNVSAAAFRFYINGGSAGGDQVVSTTTPTTATWYFLAVTYQPGGTGTLKIYVNGSLQATSTTGSATIGTSTANLQMGARVFIGNEDKMNGDMDDGRVYNVVLSSTDISALYAAGAQ